MWRRRLILGLLVLAAALLALLLAGRGTAHFEDHFSNAALTQARWQFVGGAGTVAKSGGRPALRLTGESPKRYAVALADRGRVLQLDTLRITAWVRVESGLGGVAFGLQDPARLTAYRLEVDPEAHAMTLYERNLDGVQFTIANYRDERLNPKTWCRVTVAPSADEFIMLVAFGTEQPEEMMRQPQDHQHGGRVSFEQGKVGLYALGGTTWFREVVVGGTVGKPQEKTAK